MSVEKVADASNLKSVVSPDKKTQEKLSKKILTNSIVGIYSGKYPDEASNEDIFWTRIGDDLGHWLNEGHRLNSKCRPKLKKFFDRFDGITVDDYMSNYIEPIEMSNSIFEKMTIVEFQEFIKFIYQKNI